MNFYYAAQWRRGEPRAADDAASAAWVPIASLPRLRKRFAWAHMTVLLRDLARWARSQKARAGSARGVYARPIE
jgi:ADP-ribose pyrophosphatase YjhB (NUDIX family)